MEKEFTCSHCEIVITVDGSVDQWEAYIYKTRNIQNIFPDVSSDNREILLSGLCGQCFDKLFS